MKLFITSRNGIEIINLDKVVYLADKPFEAWTLDKANAEIDAAIAVQPLPAYRQLKAQVVFAQTNYSESAAIYQSLIDEGSQTAENYFGIARCREMLNDTTVLQCSTVPWRHSAVLISRKLLLIFLPVVK